VALGEQVDQQRAVVVAQLLEGLVVEGEQLAGADQEALALEGERDPAGGPAEQADAQLPLEAADVAAERLLGHVQAGGGAAEVELLGDRHEVAEQAQIQLVGHPAAPSPPRRRFTS
jgi:hypothetical protein